MEFFYGGKRRHEGWDPVYLDLSNLGNTLNNVKKNIFLKYDK